MEWTLFPSDDPLDPHGVASLLRRVGKEIGEDGIIGRQFVGSEQDMMELTQTAERRALSSDGHLYLGAQDCVYVGEHYKLCASLAQAGVPIDVFAFNDVPEIVPNLRWTVVPNIPSTLAASWFAVWSGDDPYIVVGFETSRHAPRVFEGFVSSDRRVIAEVIEYLSTLG